MSPPRLSKREDEVFKLCIEGQRPGAISQSLKLSIKTISTYRMRIAHKLGFNKISELNTFIRKGASSS